MLTLPMSDPRPSHEPFVPVDRAWLRMDEPDNLMVITGVMFFDRLDIESLRQVIRDRLLGVKRFGQRVGQHDDKLCWIDVPDIDLDEHVQTLTLESPGDQSALESTVSRLMSTPLPYDKPLWRFYLVEDYQGKSAMISRLHHAIGDGVALMMVLLSLTDLERQPEGATTSSSPFAALLHPDRAVRESGFESARELMPEVFKLMSRVSKAIGGRPPLAKRARTAAGLSGALAKLTLKGPDAKTPLKGPLSVTKRVAWSDVVDLATVKSIRSSLGGTINDVLVTAMSGGIRRYLEHREHPVEGLDIRAAVPVSLRRLSQLADMGNLFGLVFLALPVGIVDPRIRLAEVQKRMEALKGSYEAPVALGVLGGMGRVPLRIQRLVLRIFGMKATAVVTNVPGPRQPLYLGGSKIEDFLFWVPQSGRLGVGISILSYHDRVRLGVTTDAGLVPEPQRIVDAFHEELDAMRALAGCD